MGGKRYRQGGSVCGDDDTSLVDTCEDSEVLVESLLASGDDPFGPSDALHVSPLYPLVPSVDGSLVHFSLPQEARPPVSLLARLADSPGRLPLAILIHRDSTPRAPAQSLAIFTLLVVSFTGKLPGALQPVVAHRYLGTASTTLELQDVYDDGVLDCVICYEHPRIITLLPCRHLSVCDDCFSRYMDSCPICREKVSGYLKPSADTGASAAVEKESADASGPVVLA